MTLHVRTANAAAVAPAVLREVQDLCRDVPTFEMQTLASQIDATLLQERLIATLCGFFAGLALLLASIGLYGLMAYAAARRTNEIGIRMALGAQRGDVLRLFVSQGVLLIAAGIGIGLVGAFVSSRLLQDLLFEVKSSDPATYIGVALLLALVALVACLGPAQRATKVDPMVALRAE
jgi:ABC-type antimicrobial peptide transport system permease subunit